MAHHLLRTAPIAALALLAACGDSGSPSPASQSTATEIEPVDNMVTSAPSMADAANAADANAVDANAAAPASALREVTYSCVPATTIIAHYDNSDPDDAEVKISFQGKVYDLDIARSASGARYTSDDGRGPGKTLTWWTKGFEATLYEGTKGGKPEEDKVIATCKEKA